MTSLLCKDVRSSIDMIYVAFADLKILSALRSCEPESINALPDLSGDIGDLSLVGTLADFYDRELVATIGWAKQVPGEYQIFAFTCSKICHILIVYRVSMYHGSYVFFMLHIFTDAITR